jgi:hypothetical protein
MGQQYAGDRGDGQLGEEERQGGHRHVGGFLAPGGNARQSTKSERGQQTVQSRRGVVI